MTHEIAPWRAVWKGGRLADVFHMEFSTALDTFEVDGFNWNDDTTTGTREDFERGLAEWIAEQGPTYLAELRWYR